MCTGATFCEKKGGSGNVYLFVYTRMKKHWKAAQELNHVNWMWEEDFLLNTIFDTLNFCQYIVKS